MNDNFDTAYNYFPEGTYLITAYDDPTFVSGGLAVQDIDGIVDEIERLKARCQFMPDQFFNDLATKINPKKTDVLIPELKSLVDKIFFVLDNSQNSSCVKEIKELVQYLLRIYEEGKFHSYKKKMSGDIAILFKKYLHLYIPLNFHRFKGDMDGFQRGLANPSSADRNSLENMNKWVFYYGTHIMIFNFHHLLKAIFGTGFREMTIECLNWESAIVETIKRGHRLLGFEEGTIKEFWESKFLSSESFLKWVSTSWRYVFNEVLLSNFTRFRQYNSDTFNYLYRIHNDLKVFAEWVQHGMNPTPLVPFLIFLDIFSTEGFSGSQDDFDAFFNALHQFYVRMIFHRCRENFLLRKPSYDSRNFDADDVKKEMENNIVSLTPAQINFLKLEFEKYEDTVEFFKDLIYKDENNISPRYFDRYSQFADFLKFILELIEKIRGGNNPSELFDLASYDNSMSYFYP